MSAKITGFHLQRQIESNGSKTWGNSSVLLALQSENDRFKQEFNFILACISSCLIVIMNQYYFMRKSIIYKSLLTCLHDFY